ncbi:MAG: amino acid permease [Chitinophagales bacterium]|nr:amino acid permease [Chitinophagales bacterium]
MPSLDKKLTLYGLTMIAIGSCIGSGIFVTPYAVVQAVPHHGFVLLVWALGGLIALTGALTFAELGGMYPGAGGVYVYLKEAYGELAGFLYGWVILLVINTGALAALGIALAEYLSYFYPFTYSGKIVVAIVTVASLTLINMLGVNTSQWLANLFSGLKLLAIAGIIIAGFLFYDADKIQLEFNLMHNVPTDLGSALLLALIGVLWSFGGWHHASYLAGEAVEPQRTVPRAMVLGALIVTAMYVLVNLSYMLLMPLNGIANTTRVAGEAVGQFIQSGGQIVAIAIAISIFGTIAIYTMSAPRIYFAMAKDGIFFSALAKVHPRFHTPVNAMLLQAIWAIILLLLWGTFADLITYVTFMDIAFMALAGASIFIFRSRHPKRERPYRTWAYPIVPGIFVLISSAFVVNTLIQRPSQALAGLILLALGVGVYYAVKAR